MPARKRRIPVVADTNVFIRGFKARSKNNANRRFIRLRLLEKRLQLIVSADVIAEYLEVFARVIGLDGDTLAEWRRRRRSSHLRSRGKVPLCPLWFLLA
jgi:hypothetical protein